MKNHSHIEQRLIDLEIKVSFNEELVEQLNHTIFQHQQKIDALGMEIRQLRNQIPDGNSGNSGAFQNLRDELPPHY